MVGAAENYVYQTDTIFRYNRGEFVNELNASCILHRNKIALSFALCPSFDSERAKENATLFLCGMSKGYEKS